MTTYAENKYDLLLVNTKTGKKVQVQPWWKERLETKYLSNKKKGDTSKTLIASQWTFVKDGLDDFRGGGPPPQDDIMIRGKKGPEPNVKDLRHRPKQRIRRPPVTRDQAIYSKALPGKEQRTDHIDELEFGLTQHPLALYPHFEECMPPDLFEDVVDMLDADMHLASDDDDEEVDVFGEFESAVQTPVNPNESTLEIPHNKSPRVSEVSSVIPDEVLKNPYRWLQKKDESEKDNTKKVKKLPSASEDEHINQVTREFCQWVTDLGGETNNIEESTITSLFASGYETKPALSVPIHVVELTNVPPELRMSAGNTPSTSAKHRSSATPDQLLQDIQRPVGPKMRYGAWYLDPDTWQPLAPDEPLQDPKDTKQELSETKQRSLNLDHELAQLHGARAFKDFIDKKKQKARCPEFLNRVADIQAKANLSTDQEKSEQQKDTKPQPPPPT